MTFFSPFQHFKCPYQKKNEGHTTKLLCTNTQMPVVSFVCPCSKKCCISALCRWRQCFLAGFLLSMWCQLNNAWGAMHLPTCCWSPGQLCPLSHIWSTLVCYIHANCCYGLPITLTNNGLTVLCVLKKAFLVLWYMAHICQMFKTYLKSNLWIF